jgi:hypothetical protein
MAIIWKRSWLDGGVEEASGPLFIGSHATIGGPIIGLRELLSIRPYIHSSYTIPSDDVLKRSEVVFVYDVEDGRRFLQLEQCCAYQRKNGGIKSIYAVLRVLDEKLADRILNELGAQFRLLGETSFGPSAR